MHYYWSAARCCPNHSFFEPTENLLAATASAVDLVGDLVVAADVVVVVAAAVAGVVDTWDGTGWDYPPGRWRACCCLDSHLAVVVGSSRETYEGPVGGCRRKACPWQRPLFHRTEEERTVDTSSCLPNVVARVGGVQSVAGQQ